MNTRSRRHRSPGAALRFLSWGLLGLSVAACGTTATYSLPTPVRGVDAALDGLVDCAGGRGLQNLRDGRNLNVKAEDNAWIHYTADPESGMRYVLQLSGPYASATPDTEIFQRTRETAESLWACSQQWAAGPPPAPVPVQVVAVAPAPAPQPQHAPPPSTPPASAGARWSSRCAQLAECYLELTKLLCGGQSRCESKVEVEGRPAEADCERLLRGSQRLLAPIRMVRPDVRTPEACVVR